jgi:hypothetical protein
VRWPSAPSPTTPARADPLLFGIVITDEDAEALTLVDDGAPTRGRVSCSDTASAAPRRSARTCPLGQAVSAARRRGRTKNGHVLMDMAV